MTRVLHVIGIVGGGLTAVATLAAVGNALLYWSQHETLRIAPVSQAAFFLGLALVAFMGVIVGIAALRTETRWRSLIILSGSGALLLNGAGASGAGSVYAVPLFYVGLLGLLAGLCSLVDSRRPMAELLGGLVGSLAVLMTVGVTVSAVKMALP